MKTMSLQDGEVHCSTCCRGHSPPKGVKADSCYQVKMDSAWSEPSGQVTFHHSPRRTNEQYHYMVKITIYASPLKTILTGSIVASAQIGDKAASLKLHSIMGYFQSFCAHLKVSSILLSDLQRLVLPDEAMHVLARLSRARQGENCICTLPDYASMFHCT